MKTPPDISGNDLVTCLCRHWDYHFIKQIGRHVRLETLSPRFQRVTIPLHDTIKDGLVAAILKTVASHKRVEVHNVLDTF
ncbi:MAG: type II toxin-antitoxin system HicA family toxin [Verrucomicrobia bacterium]|nr:type II toxin-antitoxin system HicA family toxin [Verrucomicrobiota bacterium]MBV9642712.1 type II toxin-antitoxin system HicA family toxin [Verrucomicrobiota bacterium]